MKKIRVAQVDCGGRGIAHLEGWMANDDRFEVVALCELDAARMKAATERFGIAPELYTDADRMLAEIKPDLFCFATMPNVRLSMVELAAKHSIKGLAFEKPMALTLSEASRIVELCRDGGIKATVCQQHLYTTSFLKLKEIIDAGEIGTPAEIHATTTGNLFDRGCHYTHYLLWASGFARPRWVIGHMHGRGQFVSSHPSPDFCLVRLEFDNGVRALGEFGAMAPLYEPDGTWQVNRVTVHGSHGTAWAENTGLWGAFSTASNGDALRGEGAGYTRQNPGAGWSWQAPRIQAAYARDIADSLEGTLADHPCSVEYAYRGFEVLAGACYSALERVRVDFPLADASGIGDVFKRLQEQLPESPLGGAVR